MNCIMEALIINAYPDPSVVSDWMLSKVLCFSLYIFICIGLEEKPQKCLYEHGNAV